jgi:hypothetical protein
VAPIPRLVSNDQNYNPEYEKHQAHPANPARVHPMNAG